MALVLLVALLVVGLLAAGLRVPGAGLARSIAAKILCAVEISDSCERDSALVAAYGLDLARLVREHAPAIVYESGMRALPVDYRACRRPACADGARSGLVSRSRAGRPVAGFVHVIDCRDEARWRTEASGAKCSGDRAGRLYLQYWLYYPDSATLRDVPVAGRRGYHADDWESYQVRIEPGGETDARASSHHGYNYEGGRRNWGSDAGIGPLRDLSEAVGLRTKGGWGPATGYLFVSGGSHAGHASGDSDEIVRVTPRRRLRLIPLEALAARAGQASFAITPPWLKEVWSDPEAEGTG